MQTTPQPAAHNTPWSTHPGYDLSRYTVISDAVNDRDRHHPGTVLASVVAEKFTGCPNTRVRMDLSVGPADMQVRMSPEKARALAQAILDAADIVDAFEADGAMAQEAELARFNAGPIRHIPLGQRVVEVAKGYFAFEPATCNTVNEGGAA
mgnify:FL=1